MPSREWTLDEAAIADACSQAQRQLNEWDARTGFVDFWFSTTASRLAPGEEVRVVVDYDVDAGLLSFDAWVHGRRVYGADDFLG